MEAFRQDLQKRTQFVSRLLVLLGIFILNFQVIFPYTGLQILAYYWEQTPEQILSTILGPPEQESALLRIFFNAWVNLGGFAVTAFIYFKMFYTRYLPKGQITARPVNIKIMGYTWVLFASALILNNIVGWFNAWIPYPSWWGMDVFLQELDSKIKLSTELFLNMPNLGRFIINLFLIALVPAVSEELFFRGALQNVLMPRSGKPHVAIIITSLFFALIHLKYSHFLPIFGMSVVFGYVYYYTQNILYVMLLHFFNNGLILVMYYYFRPYTEGFLMQETHLPPWYVMLPALAVFIWAMIQIISRTQKFTKHPELYE